MENSALHTVHIGSKIVTPQSTYLAEVLAEARREVKREDQSRAAEQAVAPVELPLVPKKAHTVIAQPNLHKDVRAFLAELRKSKTDRNGFVYLKYIKVAPADIDRVGKFISSMASELEPYEFAFDAGSNRVGFSKNGTKVDFEITAPRKRVIKTSRSGWEHYDYEHAGRLSMRIFGWGKARRKIGLIPILGRSKRPSHKSLRASGSTMSSRGSGKNSNV
ncbi:hypothetical protein [Sinorhizobium psoraleae]|uniref:Uncharacterized protein n=1 Tax=Sinorhizobium psoraleae TaxID=520838 RepID=A0ABT4KF65_9HYPH|nr:hypothetical protein [Sinorhizobium psoraleae]MCZ4090604.1 hypothetical protein [Sinorhizobium psoraleae]